MDQLDEVFARLAEASTGLDRLHEMCTNRNERAVVHQRATAAQGKIAEAVKLLSASRLRKDEQHHSSAPLPAIAEKPAAGKKP